MKTKTEVQAEIRRFTKERNYILRGELSTIQINAPRALMQLATVTKLETLHWVLGTKFKPKFKIFKS